MDGSRRLREADASHLVKPQLVKPLSVGLLPLQSHDSLPFLLFPVSFHPFYQSSSCSCSNSTPFSATFPFAFFPHHHREFFTPQSYRAPFQVNISNAAPMLFSSLPFTLRFYFNLTPLFTFAPLILVAIFHPLPAP